MGMRQRRSQSPRFLLRTPSPDFHLWFVQFRLRHCQLGSVGRKRLEFPIHFFSAPPQALFRNSVLPRYAVEDLHLSECLTLVLANIEGHEEIGMADPSSCVCFPLETI